MHATGVTLRRQPVAVICGVALLAIVAVAVAAPWAVPFKPNAQSLGDSLASPGGKHLLGADRTGRDVLSRTIYGARTSLSVGFGSMVVGTVLATLLGGLSGYLGGRTDALVQRLVDAFLSVPTLVLLLTVLSVIGASLLKIILVIGVSAMITSSRTIRSAVIAVKARPYIEAARAVGCGPGRVFVRHILANVAAPTIVVASLIVGYAILIESSLSFLGFGVPPPAATWGSMLAGDGRAYMVAAPWLVAAPGVALTLVIVCINLFGDGLRDILDPRLRERR
jgi:peptide/nickel transport system permease protein